MFGNWKFKKRKNLCGLGVSAVKKVYRRGAGTRRLVLMGSGLGFGDALRASLPKFSI